MKRKNVSLEGLLTGSYVSRFTPPCDTPTYLPTPSLRPQFNELIALLQAFRDVGPHGFDPDEQDLGRAVSFANPDESSRAVAEKPAVNEVLVLADDDRMMFDCVFPKHGIVCRVESQVEGVNGLVMPEAAYPPGKGWRKLCIDEEVHTAWSTA